MKHLLFIVTFVSIFKIFLIDSFNKSITVFFLKYVLKRDLYHIIKNDIFFRHAEIEMKLRKRTFLLK